jgi:membrane associated rhomboid family serine protease
MSSQPPDSPPPQPQPADAEQVPVCARHPDRISYIRCQRCARPTCPECQRAAAVGVHCVDCVHEHARTAPVARTAFGAPLRGGRPVVTLTLIGMCVASFLLQLTLGPGTQNPWTEALIFAPFLGAAEPWRFLTAAFLHSTGMLLHILFNMYALYLVGQALEPALGRWRFLSLYVLSAIGGTVMYTLLASPVEADWVRGVVGASGAVFGLFGALLVVLRRLNRSARPLVVLLAINGVLGFVIPNIAWEAHLGGLVVGIVLGLAFAYAPRTRRTLVGVSACVAVLVVLVLLVAAKYATVSPFLLA